MVIYQKKVDGIIYEQQVIETKEAERVKELIAQGWSKVEAPTPKADKAKAPAPAASVTAPVPAGQGTIKAKEQ